MSTSTPVARPSRRQRKPRSDLKLGLAFILPATIGLVAFYIWPLIRGIWLSFTEYNLLTPEEFTGLDNYKRMAQDDTFWNAVVVTVEYVVINIGLQTILALLIAVLMQRLTQSTFVRSIVLTPYLVSNVVAAMLWLWILDHTGHHQPAPGVPDGLSCRLLLLVDGHPHHRHHQRVAARGLHGPAHLRGSAVDPEHGL